MSPRREAPVQEPLPPFKKEVDLSVQAHLERQRQHQERNRELARERSRSYRARKASKRTVQRFLAPTAAIT